MIPLSILINIFFSPLLLPIGGSLNGAWVVVGLAVLTIVLMMEAGTWQIAPAADRTSSVARAATIVWLPCAGVAIGALASGSMPVQLQVSTAIWTGILVGFVVIGSLCEPQSTIPSVYAGFFGRGPIRRLLGWVLAPGWASGVMFTIAVTLGAGLALLAPHRSTFSAREVLAVLAALLLPVPIMRTTVAQRLRPAAAYVVVQVLSFGVGVISPFAEALSAHTVAVLTAWLLPLSPVMSLVMHSEQPVLVPDLLDWMGWGVSGAIVLAAFVQAARALNATERRVRQRARPEPTPEDESPPASAASAA
jgi:hypothetical protein